MRKLVAVTLRQALRRNRRVRLILVALVTVLGLSSTVHRFGLVGGAQAVTELATGIDDVNDTGLPAVAVPAPPEPCSGNPPASGPCTNCTTNVPGASAYESGLPVPSPLPGFNYVVQLVNETTVTVLAAANAAHQGSSAPGGPTPGPIVVQPREGKWIMLPKGSPNNGNILTIDIPPGWESTECPQTNKDCGAVGPRFFVRTGCKYDIEHNLAQCETGSCGDAYDCGKQALRNLASSGKTPVSIVEWDFNSQGGQGYTFPDISLVDGVTLTVDVQAIGRHCASKPGVPTEPNWLSEHQPLAIHGADLREPGRCIPNFRLTRGEVGQIIQGDGNPNDVVACFTNCGRYEYPTTPDKNCDPHTDARCKNWLAFCCYTPPDDPNHVYNHTCGSDSDCAQSGACWDNGNGPATCQCRAFLKDPGTCPPNVCTHPNPPNRSAQPEFGKCTDVTMDPNACIGDDTVHRVFPGGYTWPSDPQTYVSDARAYRVIFAPGGTTVATTDSGSIPSCGSLPEAYGYDWQVKSCSAVINSGALFAGAALSPSCNTTDDCPIIPGSQPPTRSACDPMYKRCATWSCQTNDGGPVATGLTLCRWAASGPSPTPTTTPQLHCIAPGGCGPPPPITATPTNARSDNDDGCAVVPNGGGSRGGALLALIAGAVLLRIRRNRR